MSDEVLVHAEDGILIVTINRPQARNAVNLAVAEGIAEAMDELDSNSDLRVAILTGAEGTFCSGMDLKGFLKGENPVAKDRGFAGLVEGPPAKPLIAAVEGYALAGGCEIALACDLIVAGDSAKFGVPEVKRGLVAAGGGLIRLPRQISYRLAMELALTGDSIDAERALAIGLINSVVPAGGALEAAKALAARINANGPLAVSLSKKIVAESGGWDDDKMFATQQEIAMPAFISEDAIEGSAAFAEKRAPNWKGK